jgi:thiol-disulfide isomerase/thioredoxin
MRFKVLAVSLTSIVLVGYGHSLSASTESNPVEVIETAWTDAAVNRTEALIAQRKLKYALPELRIYDARQKLIFHQIGDDPPIADATLNRAISADRGVEGPSFAQTAADLQTADHYPASGLLRRNGEITIFDYWADWCVPCKALGKQLMAWAATRPRGTVRIVRAETDLIKAERARGHEVKVNHVKKTDG